jgi:ABC-2 type transport system permease protein
VAQYWQEIHALTMRWVSQLMRSQHVVRQQPMLFWLIFSATSSSRRGCASDAGPDYISFLTAGVVDRCSTMDSPGVDLSSTRMDFGALMTTPIHRTL